MEQVAHWTHSSVENFVYEISSTFVAQLETKMEEQEISRSDLAKRLGKTTGRVSQVFNDPGNLGLKLIVEYASELGLKVSLIAYDDNDPNNEKGPINPEVFVKSWEKQGCPSNVFEVEEAKPKSIWTGAAAAIVPVTGAPVFIATAYGAGQASLANPAAEGFSLMNPAKVIVSDLPSVQGTWIGQPILSTLQARKEKICDAA